MRLPLTQNCPKYCMGKVSRIPTIGDYTIFFNSLFFVLYSASFLTIISDCKNDRKSKYLLEFKDTGSILIPWKKNSKNYFVTSDRLDQQSIIKLWEHIVLTPKEDIILDAFRILEPNLDRIAFLNLISLEFSIKLKLKDNPTPVPLGSMGDGLYRILALIIALVNCEKGILLIDEVDTGLHYSALTKMWQLVIETARKLNVQVFATTHSWDALAAFQKAMSETETGAFGNSYASRDRC